MIQVKWKSMIIYLLVILVAVFAALALYFYQIIYKSDYFLPGVHIASVSVSGYDLDGAADLLQAELNYLSDTTLSFYYRDYRYDTRLGEVVKSPDPQKIVFNIWEREKKRSLISKILNLNGAKTIEYPIKITYDEHQLNNIGSLWQENLDSDYVNARLEIDPALGLMILPSQKGLKVDVPSTLALLPIQWNQSENLLIKIVANEENPRVNESDLKDMGEIAAFSTWYNPNQINRSHNVVLATRAINTTMVKPGEVFSYNKTVGRREYDNGYRDAMVIIGDKFEEGLGGGICQVSSTLYNACLFAGLKIIERHPHNLAVAYVPLGQDATVSYDQQDFRFQNNFDDPVYIWAIVGNGKVTMKIYSKLKYKQKIQVSHVVDQVIDFKEITETKEDLPPGTTKVEQNGSPGYVVRAFRTFYNSDGSVARQEQLSRDNYRPLNRRVLVGPSETSADPGQEVAEGDPVTTVPREQTNGEPIRSEE